MTTALLHAHRCMLKDVPVGKTKRSHKKLHHKLQVPQIENHKSQVPYKQEIATPGASTFACKYNPRPDCSKSHHRAEVFRSAEHFSSSFSFVLIFFSFSVLLFCLLPVTLLY